MMIKTAKYDIWVMYWMLAIVLHTFYDIPFQHNMIDTTETKCTKVPFRNHYYVEGSVGVNIWGGGQLEFAILLSAQLYTPGSPSGTNIRVCANATVLEKHV